MAEIARGRRSLGWCRLAAYAAATAHGGVIEYLGADQGDRGAPAFILDPATVLRTGIVADDRIGVWWLCLG